MDLESVEAPETEYPRMQILTIAEIINGERFKTPSVAGRHTLEPGMPGIST